MKSVFSIVLFSLFVAGIVTGADDKDPKAKENLLKTARDVTKGAEKQGTGSLDKARDASGKGNGDAAATHGDNNNAGGGLLKDGLDAVVKEFDLFLKTGRKVCKDLTTMEC